MKGQQRNKQGVIWGIRHSPNNQQEMLVTSRTACNAAAFSPTRASKWGDWENSVQWASPAQIISDYHQRLATTLALRLASLGRKKGPREKVSCLKTLSSEAVAGWAFGQGQYSHSSPQKSWEKWFYRKHRPKHVKQRFSGKGFCALPSLPLSASVLRFFKLLFNYWQFPHDSVNFRLHMASDWHHRCASPAGAGCAAAPENQACSDSTGKKGFFHSLRVGLEIQLAGRLSCPDQVSKVWKWPVISMCYLLFPTCPFNLLVSDFYCLASTLHAFLAFYSASNSTVDTSG